jgi:hypothetical protein
MTNFNLTADNESKVMRLIRNERVKARWQELSVRFGKTHADLEIATWEELPIQVVKAARYYW